MIREPLAGHVVWVDGAYVAWGDAKMHVSDHHYGVGVFEGVRAYSEGSSTAIFRLNDHTARLFRSAHILGMRIPDRYDASELNRVQVELVRRNKLRSAYLRPFVFYGGAAGLSPRTWELSVHVAVLALEWTDEGAYDTGDKARRGISLRTSSFSRAHPNSLLSKAKANANYMNGILALQEAHACGADDALILDHNGFATETSGANLFVVRDGVISTPPLSSVLEGVTRNTILTLAARQGLTVKEQRLSRDEIYVADEVFLTGTAVEVTPVRELDGRRIGSGARGPLTERFQGQYAALVRGRGEQFDEWLTRV